jgi:hypothetical protein
MPLACLFVDESAVTTDLDGLTAVALLGRHEFDAAVAVQALVPVHKGRHLLKGGLFAREWPTWLVRPVFGHAEEGF